MEAGNTPVIVNQNVDTDDVADVIGSIPAVITETKAGYKTTEFWAAIALTLAVTLEGITVPAKYEGALVVAIGALYMVSRGLAKKGVPHVEPLKDE